MDHKKQFNDWLRGLELRHLKDLEARMEASSGPGETGQDYTELLMESEVEELREVLDSAGISL